MFLKLFMLLWLSNTSQINPEDIDSDEKRCDLFHSLIKDSDDNGKLESLGMVLIAWPVLSVVENKYVVVYRE